MATERTVDEAIEYISETILLWKEEVKEGKIISLAAFAEKWRSTSGGPTALYHDLQKNIKAMELIIKRNENRNIPTDGLKVELTEMYNSFTDVCEKLGKSTTTTTTGTTTKEPTK
jgi:hypothetical protein